MTWRPRPTVRLRLTLLYGGLVAATGALLLGLTYVLAVHTLPSLGIAPPARPEPAFPFRAPDPPTPQSASPEDGPRFLTASVLALAGMTAVSVGIGWALAGRMLRPLRTMSATAGEISATNLHRRLDVSGPDDEITGLARTFDDLIARLEAAFEAQRRFVANASHELRTPLTFERSLLEVALADPDASAPDLRAVCERALANNAHQEHVIEALLTLARSQRGLDRCADVNVAAVARDAVGQASVGAAADAALRVDTVLRPADVRGDARLIERLAANLVDNAVRHNVPGGWIRVRTGVEAGRTTLRVANSGPVVPPDQVEGLFQPFRRLDATRTAGVGGVGLGLSIVAAVAEAHGAELVAVAHPDGGLDIRVTFPRTHPPSI